MPFHLLLLAGSLALAQPGKPSFVVECRIVDLQKVAHSEGKKNDSTGSVAAHIETHRLAHTLPRLTLSDGESATISNESQRPFVTAVKSTTHGKEAAITILNEGTKVALSVTSVDSEYVTLDATIQDSSIVNVEERVADQDGTLAQAPTVESAQVRLVGPVRLGEKREIELGHDSDRTVELVIRRSDAPLKQLELPFHSDLEGPWRIEKDKSVHQIGLVRPSR